jgi:hypothetical protein
MLLNKYYFKVFAAKKKFCLLIKSEPTGGFNLKSSYPPVKVGTNGKIIGGIVDL